MSDGRFIEDESVKKKSVIVKTLFKEERKCQRENAFFLLYHP